MSEVNIPDISPIPNLKPQTRRFEGYDEPLVNLDGVLKIMAETNTPEARAFNRAFRKRLAEQRMAPDLPEDEQRKEAFFAACTDLGFKLNLVPDKP